MAFLKAENLSKIYMQSKTVQTAALKDINLEIQKGDFIVINGPSGSGKTTLLNLIGGLDEPTAGKIFLEEKEIGSINEKELAEIRLRNMGFIFQAYNLIPVLTAMENIEYIEMLQGVPKEERRENARKIAAHLGIEDLLDKRPNEMSGGQQQRVAVARAIVAKPKLILADEPTANLDSVTGENLMDMMRKLNENEGITFVFSTHEKMVMDKAKRSIVLKDGKIFSDEK